jgi:hypothetical protein
MRWPPFVRRAERVGETGGGIRELPIAVLPWVRVPFIGTTIVALGPRHVGRVCGLLSDEFLVNVELHGIDLCGPDDPGMADLAGHQPDATLPLPRKRDSIQAMIDHFRGLEAEFVTLAEAAELAFQKPLKG